MLKKTRKYKGLFYILPWIAGLIIFRMYPVIYSFILSFTDGNILDTPSFTGLENYRRMLEDDDLKKSILVTLLYTFVEVPLKLVASLFTAYLLSKKIKGMGFFRTAYYIPTILGSNIAVSVMWKYLFYSKGYTNQFLGVFGIEPISWFGEPLPALFTVVLLRVWEFGSTMIVFLAGLNEVPKELYEAAEIDGCTPLRKLFSITLPMMRNVIFFNFIMQMIQAFQEFNAPYMVTGGAPLNFTYFIAMFIYDHSFVYFDMGYASAVSWVLMILISVMSAFVFRISDGGNNEEK